MKVGLLLPLWLWASDYVVFIVGWKPMFVAFIIEWKPLLVVSMVDGNPCMLLPLLNGRFIEWKLMMYNEVLYGNSYQDIGVCKELRHG